MTEVRCPHCGAFLMATNAPWGKVTTYCRGCKKPRTIWLGKAPVDQREAAGVVVRIDRIKPVT